MLSVSAAAETDRAVSRLQALGATLTGVARAGALEASMTDPGGNEFRVVTG